MPLKHSRNVELHSFASLHGQKNRRCISACLMTLIIRHLLLKSERSWPREMKLVFFSVSQSLLYVVLSVLHAYIHKYLQVNVNSCSFCGRNFSTIEHGAFKNTLHITFKSKVCFGNPCLEMKLDNDNVM
jgi:hypothetical protein